ncbi:Peptidase inhibitor I78 family protein [compost metagenome]
MKFFDIFSFFTKKQKIMKKILFLGLALVSLTACSSVQHKDPTPPKIGSPNPASQYCVEQGGKLEIRNEANGQVGYCHLPNGQVVEEWKLFRDNQANCVAEEAQKLVGQSGLTDDQIKQKTQSEIVRKVAPGQPMTMDYRTNRVTVTIDPASKKITNATCG